jgi:anti-sigma B factor antagonist
VGNRQELKATVQAGVDAGGRKFLLDCSPTGYIDSSGLGALVTIAKRVREAGGQIRLAGLNDDLRSLFELTKLDTLFAIYPGIEEALQGSEKGQMGDAGMLASSGSLAVPATASRSVACTCPATRPWSIRRRLFRPPLLRWSDASRHSLPPAGFSRRGACQRDSSSVTAPTA